MRPLVILVVLSLLVVLGVVAYPYWATNPSSLGKDQAVGFVLDDVKPLQDQGVDARVVDVRKNGNQWAVDVLLTRNAHSKCPSVDKRFYTLPPVGFRTEPIVSACTPVVSVDYREEALINSQAAFPDLSASAYGCAFLAGSLLPLSPANNVTASTYCPMGDYHALASFATGLPSASWVVAWFDGGTVRYAALSSSGQTIKTA